MTEKKLEELYAGKVIFIEASRENFMSYRVENWLLMYRIGKTDKALAMRIGISFYRTLGITTAWMIGMVNARINAVPATEWKQTTDLLSKQYDIPIKVLSINDPQVSNSVRVQFEGSSSQISKILRQRSPVKKGISLYQLFDKGPVDIAFDRVSNQVLRYIYINPKKDKHFVVRFGPFPPAYWWNKSVLLISTLMYSMAFIVLIILTWLFGKSLDKIYKITDSCSRGNFDFSPKVKKISLLYDLYVNVNYMRIKIKSLIQSHHNMSRFIAHESKTPLSTMSFALHGLIKEARISKKAMVHIDSIRRDIDEINDLISGFILYSQSSTQELKINQTYQDINQWLGKILVRYEAASINVDFIPSESDLAKKVYFDPVLMKHVIDNLLTNAIKYAKELIQVSVFIENDSVCINIDDDGVVIPESDREKLLQPFVILKQSSAAYQQIGLGLSIVYNIVQLHDGVVSILESPIGGTRVSISIPLLESQ